MEWLAGIAVKLFSGPFLDAYKAHLASVNSTDQQAVQLAIQQIQADIARRNAQRDLGLAAMSHPVWWLAWLLFVVPVGMYHASIFLLSTFGIKPDVFAVLEVPKAELELSNTIIQYLFLSQSASGIIGTIAMRFRK